MAHFEFDNEHDFVEKLKQLKSEGVDSSDIDIRSPHPVHHLEEILGEEKSNVRKFALTGGLLGAATGYLFPSFTHLHWPLNNAGKPIVSLPPFTIISFELMVLFGALTGFLGLLLTSRMPAVRTIISNDEFVDSYTITVSKDK